MTKNVIKEIIIILLLCLAIILILGILLYNYVPMSKTVPSPVLYSTPESVKEELMTTGDVDEDEIVMTYEIDSTALNNYKKTQDYQPGKSNPFSSYQQQETTTTETGTNETKNVTTNATQNSNNSSSNNTTTTQTNNNQTQTNSEQTQNTSKGFYPDTGTK